MIIAGCFTVPDACPESCRHRGSFAIYGQSALCGRCPVLCCSRTEYEDGELFCLIEPEDFRPDWAAEWVRFFQDGTEPHLRLKREVHQ